MPSSRRGGSVPGRVRYVRSGCGNTLGYRPSVPPSHDVGCIRWPMVRLFVFQTHRGPSAPVRKAAFGPPFSFQARSWSHWTLHRLPGVPGCDGGYEAAEIVSDSKGSKPDLTRQKGSKLVLILTLDGMPQQTRSAADGCLANFVTIIGSPVEHRFFDVSLALRVQIAIVKCGRDRGP
jgi:hypothetical protein